MLHLSTVFFMKVIGVDCVCVDSVGSPLPWCRPLSEEEPTNARPTEEACNQSETDTDPEEPEEVVYLSLPYIGERGEAIVKGTVKKLMKLFKKDKNVRVKTFFETKKLSFYVSKKDRTPLLSNSGVIYEY